MKRFCSVILPFILVTVMLLVLPVSAYEETFEWTLDIGEEFVLGSSVRTYVSSDPSVVEIRYNDTWCYAVGVGEGCADVYCDSDPMPEYRFYVSDSFFMQAMYLSLGEKALTILLVAGIIAAALAAGSMVYIFLDSKKHGMSRLWVWLPLVLNVAALGLYVIFRQENGKKAAQRQIICPQCGTPHPQTTLNCTKCGRRLH